MCDSTWPGLNFYYYTHYHRSLAPRYYPLFYENLTPPTLISVTIRSGTSTPASLGYTDPPLLMNYANEAVDTAGHLISI